VSPKFGFPKGGERGNKHLSGASRNNYRVRLLAEAMRGEHQRKILFAVCLRLRHGQEGCEHQKIDFGFCVLDVTLLRSTDDNEEFDSLGHCKMVTQITWLTTV
jgi:hypothetical protein